jgi:outer membrane protein insertion porin family
MFKAFNILIILFISYTLEVFPQAIINSVEFEGNNYFSENDLFASMALKRNKTFNANQLNLDLKSIREKYRDAGFLLSKILNYKTVFDKDSSVVDIKVYIDEGRRVNIGKIIFSGNTNLSSKKILEVFETKIGNPLDGNTMNNDIKALLDLYEKKGIPFAKAYIKDISLYYESGIPKLEVAVSIIEESKIKIEQIRIKGNETTQDKVILRELKIGDDKVVKREWLQDMKTRLDKLNIFEKVDDPKIYTIKKTGTTGLLIQVKEGNTNTFDGVIGYAPATVNESGYFTGMVNVSFRNIFGTGRRVDARWQKPLKSTQELEFKYAEPYFLGFPVNMNAGFLQRIQDTTYTRRKIDIKGDVLLNDKFTISFLAGLDRVIPSADTTRVFSISDSRILYSGLELKYDSRDNIYNPFKGILYSSSYTYGSKTVYNSVSSSNDESFSIQKFSSQVEVYFSLFNRQSIMLRFFGGEAISSKLEDADFFRIGGNKYIRGYRDEQFLASKLTYSNVELRYSVSRKSFLFGFYDFGYYFRPEDLLNFIPKQEGFLYGYGIGIQLETALGIVGVSYGLGKGEGLTDGMLHFGIINDF